MRPRIWTQSLRKIMYRRLLKKFGPYSGWERKKSRQPANPEDFKLVVKELASIFSKRVGRKVKPSAVEMQINFGITKQHDLRNQSHVQNLILNKSAALEVKFISSSDLPKYMFMR